MLAEIVRAGIQALPRGQSEAAYAIGMTKGQVTRIVLLPQAIKIMLPAMISQFVVCLKDTCARLRDRRARHHLRLQARSGPRAATRCRRVIVMAAIYIMLNLIVTCDRALGAAHATSARARPAPRRAADEAV